MGAGERLEVGLSGDAGARRRRSRIERPGWSIELDADVDQVVTSLTHAERLGDVDARIEPAEQTLDAGRRGRWHRWR